MDPSFRNTMIGGVLLYGAVALASLVAVALVTGHPGLALLAVFAMGVAYLAQYAGAQGYMVANMVLTFASVASACAAFLALALKV